MRCITVWWAVCIAAPLFAEQPVIGGAGFFHPVPLSVAPGQLITLFVQGVDTQLTAPVRASGSSLPTTLGGVSVTFAQGTGNVAVPILEVRPIQPCAGLSACTMLEVTVQMPFEMVTICPLCGRVDIAASVLVTVNGTTGTPLPVESFADQVHIVTACDVTMSGSLPVALSAGLPCQPMITHSDGKLVNFSNPAHAGEELVAYATGLGQTDPPQQTGKAAGSATSTVTSFLMDFNFRPNALATKPLPSARRNVNPIYTGVTPGFTGLYQINFVVPTPPAELPACVDPIVAFGNVVESNLTVSIGSNFSFDGAGICVQPAS